MTLGVDFGGTRIKLADVQGGRIVAETSIPTRVGSPAATILDDIAEAASKLIAAPREIGVAIPGEVDPGGRCYRLPNVPGFEGVAIARELERRTGARVAVENDATAAALGESVHGHGRTYASFLLVTLGTGVGGGLVLDRHLVRGAHGFAAEIGHVTVDASPSSPPCVCGNRGCLEAYAGTRAVLERFRTDGGNVTMEMRDVALAARRGEPAGLSALGQLSDALAVGLNSIQNVLDLDAIVFSGGISGSFDVIEPRLRAGLRGRCYAPPLGEVPLLVSELGDRAGVVGAAELPRALAARRP